MARQVEVPVPDIGDFENVDVIELLVRPGDRIALDGSLITIDSEKASMEVPSPVAGVVRELRVALGDKVSAGTVIALIETPEERPGEKPAPTSAPPSPPRTGEQSTGAQGKAAQGTAAQRGASPAPAPAGSPPEAPPAGASSDFDVAVLGSGPGGYAAAFRAADLGLRVALVVRFPVLGGVCLNVGCIPSKTLLHAARVIDEARSMAEHGVAFGAPRIELDRLRAFKQSVVDRLVGGLSQLAVRRQVTVVRGAARFADPHTFVISGADGERRISFAHAIIAAGSSASRLPFVPEDPRVMDSTGALELRDVPERLVVLGGGIIGLEMATVFQALGSRVTVVELLPGLLPGVDRDLVRPLAKRLEARCTVRLGTRATAVVASGNGLVVTLAGPSGEEHTTCDRLLVAVGRRPNGKRLGAEAAGVLVDERGFIPVDHQLRTNVPHIFAIGDIAREPMLAHKATHEGKVAAEVIAGLPVAFDARVIPSVAYTDPEVAWVGLTETTAKEQGIPYERGSFPWGASGRWLALGRDEGMTKILVEPGTRRLRGVGVVGPAAGDRIGEAARAIEMGADAEDLALTVHAHPTLSETLAFAAEVVTGTVTDLYAGKRRGA